MIEKQQWKIKISTFVGGRSLPLTYRNTSGKKTCTLIISKHLYDAAIKRIRPHGYINIRVYTLLLRSGNVELQGPAK